MLRCIIRSETDPYFNLAAEEFLLKNAAQDTFMIWCNKPSVIIGKHQNASREINHNFIESFNLPVVRRITGGGAVYHDPGNINFSFIYTKRKENLVDFRQFTRPIVLFLQDLGLNASFEGKNNIVINGFKVSGNSAHLYRNKVLHHGTLLFETDIDKLDKAIAGNEENYQDKSVRSVRSKVANITDLVDRKITKDEFIRLFISFIANYFNEAHYEDFNGREAEAITHLAREKYRTFQWNYGYSPQYVFQNKWKTGGERFNIELNVKEGKITNCVIKADGKDSISLKHIEKILIGIPHEKKSVSEYISKLTFVNKSEKQMLTDIIGNLF